MNCDSFCILTIKSLDTKLPTEYRLRLYAMYEFIVPQLRQNDNAFYITTRGFSQ